MTTGQLILFAVSVPVVGYVMGSYYMALRQRRAWKDSAFQDWVARVDARLRQYGASALERSDEDWLIDFQAGLNPDQAAKRFINFERAP